MKKHKTKDVSRTICKNSIDYIKKLSNHTKPKLTKSNSKSKSIYNKYNTYIKKLENGSFFCYWRKIKLKSRRTICVPKKKERKNIFNLMI